MRGTVGISPPYSHFAAPFALEGEQEFSRVFVRHSLEIYASVIGGIPNAVADLACGVGTACRVFSQQVPMVFGVDASSEVIRMARRTDPRFFDGECHVEYFQRDMRKFSIPVNVDLATCMYDSINFMVTENDMRDALRCAYGCIRSGGLFMFDMYTILGLSTLWGCGTEIHTDTEDHFVTTNSTFYSEAQTATKDFFGFTKQSNDTWQRWREQHTIRAYPVDQHASLVTTSGFEILSISQWNTDGSLGSNSDEAHRIFFVTRRI